MSRPTPEQIKEARRVLLEGDAVRYYDDVCIGTEDIEAIRVLLAATLPPTYEEITELTCQRLYEDPSDVFDEDRKSAFIGAKEPCNQSCSAYQLASAIALSASYFLGTPEGK